MRTVTLGILTVVFSTIVVGYGNYLGSPEHSQPAQDAAAVSAGE